MKTKSRIGVIGGIVLTLVIGIIVIYNEGYFEANGSIKQDAKDLPALLSIQSLHSFYSRDVNKNLEKLSEHVLNGQSAARSNYVSSIKINLYKVT